MRARALPLAYQRATEVIEPISEGFGSATLTAAIELERLRLLLEQFTTSPSSPLPVNLRPAELEASGLPDVAATMVRRVRRLLEVGEMVLVTVLRFQDEVTIPDELE